MLPSRAVDMVSTEMLKGEKDMCARAQRDLYSPQGGVYPSGLSEVTIALVVYKLFSKLGALG